MAGPETGMEKAEMKQLLNKATPDKPINFAFGQGKEAAFALLKMDRIKNPKACDKMLSEEFKDAKNTRWGTAVVDPAVNSSLVKFIVNKPVSAMAKRLVKTLKGTGYNKVEIVLEDGTVVEGAADEEEEGGETQGEEVGVSPPPTTSTVPPPPPPPPQPTAPQHSAADLQKALAALIPRIAPTAGENADLRAQLMKFATDANVNLKTNNLTYAAAAIGQLAKALDAAPPPQQSGTAGENAGSVIYAKSRMAWIATQQKVKNDIEKLRAELMATYKNEAGSADIEKKFQSVITPLLTTLDESLADKLDEVTNTTDAAERTKKIAEARTIMQNYQTVIASPIVADLDTNPFVPLSIQKTVTTTLTGLSAAIH